MLVPVKSGGENLSILGFVLTMLLALVLHVLPGHVGRGPDLVPALPLITLFIWSVRQPWYVSPPVLLLVGVLQDLIEGSSMGGWSLAYLVAFAVFRVREVADAGHKVGPLSLRFTLMVLAAFGIAWAVNSFAVGAPIAPGSLITEVLLTILVFPLFAWVFARCKEYGAFS